MINVLAINHISRMVIGGSCFPKDVQALINISNNFGYSPELITSVEKVNDNQKNILFSQIV